MAFSAKFTATDASAQAAGAGSYDRMILTNVGPDTAWIYPGPFDGGATDSEKAAMVVALGTPLAMDEKMVFGGPNGVATSDYYLACDTGETADIRVLC